MEDFFGLIIYFIIFLIVFFIQILARKKQASAKARYEKAKQQVEELKTDEILASEVSFDELFKEENQLETPFDEEAQYLSNEKSTWKNFLEKKKNYAKDLKYKKIEEENEKSLKEEVKLQSDFVIDLDKTELRKAILYSEILQRKYN